MLRAFALPLVLLLALTGFSAASDTPEAAIGDYFSARFAAMDGLGPASVDRIATENSRLRQYTEIDLLELRTLLASFPNPVARSHSTRIDARAGMRFDVYEETLLTWRDGPTIVRTSSVGYAHRLALTRSLDGRYVVASDAFRGIGLDSPDVTPTTTTTAGGRAGLAAVALRPNFTQGYYNWSNATLYAGQWYNGRNPAYNDYGGSDCANFTSQALYAGGEVQASGWTHGSPDSLAWINANSQSYWMTNNGRAYTVGAATSLYYGDLIYYNWASPYGTEQEWDHSTMVTAFDISGKPLVTMHSPDLGMVYWDTWMASYLRPFSSRFVAMYSSFYY